MPNSMTSQQRWLEANKHRRPKINRDSRLRLFYGISQSEVDAMLVKQGGKCAICGCAFSDSLPPHVDHCHDSGWFRGMLCGFCNFGIGNFDENIARLSAAVEYLVSNCSPTEFNIGQARMSLRKGRRKHTEQSRAEISKQMTGNKYREGLTPWNKGMPFSEDVRTKMSQAAKRNLTPERLQHLREKAKLGAQARWGLK